MDNIIFSSNQSAIALVQCFILAVSFVGSLYIDRQGYPRDHEVTIKSRMLGVATVCILAPMFIYMFSIPNDELGYPLIQWLGMHTISLYHIFIPLFLTIILFAGPITLVLVQDGIGNLLDTLTDIQSLKDIKWHRTYIVAPFTEEFIFRACMLPVLVPNFTLSSCIFSVPLFFGIAHFHHKIEQLQQGYDVSMVILSGVFQMTYTTIFGAYSAFLFLRTGSLIGPVLCHSFCNFMGFPDFEAVFTSTHPKFISLMFVAGLVLFILLLFPLTEPSLYNSVYWKL